MIKINILLLIIFLNIGCSNSDPTLLGDSAVNCETLDNLKELGITNDELVLIGDDIFSGECFTFFENTNQISEIRRYKNGVKDGKWVMFFDNGSLYYIGTARDGMIDGPFKGFYPNGQMADEGKMKKGFKNGLWKIYNTDGSLSKKTLYKNGEIIRTKDY